MYERVETSTQPQPLTIQKARKNCPSKGVKMRASDWNHRLMMTEPKDVRVIAEGMAGHMKSVPAMSSLNMAVSSKLRPSASHHQPMSVNKMGRPKIPASRKSSCVESQTLIRIQTLIRMVPITMRTATSAHLEIFGCCTVERGLLCDAGIVLPTRAASGRS